MRLLSLLVAGAIVPAMLADTQAPVATAAPAPVKVEKSEGPAKVKITHRLETRQDLDKFVNEHAKVIVKCYSKTCPHCVHIKPNFNQLARDYRDKVATAKIRSERHELLTELGVEGFPTFIVYENGKETKRILGADVAGLEATFKSLAGVTVEPKKVEPAKPEHKVKKAEKKAPKKEVAKKETGKKEHVKKEPAKKERAKKEAKKEVKKGPIVALTTEKELAPHAAKKAVVRFHADWCGACKQSLTTYEKYAGRYTDVAFITVNIDKEGDLKDIHEVKAVPTFVLFQDGKKVDTLVGFDRKELRKKIESISTIKKEPKAKVKKEEKKTEKKVEKAKPAPKPAKEAKAKEAKIKYVQALHTKGQLDNTVSANPKVIVKCYAHWCGHCRNIKPEYRRLAEQYHGKVLAAKIETSRHSELAEELKVQGVPTFIIYEKGKEVSRITGADKAGLEKAFKDLADKTL